MSDAFDPYPFEAEDEDDIRELDLESVDTFGEERITVGQLVDEHESWRFGHVIVDEAQDLTPMQWRMVMRRVRGRSLTVVGDLAQRTVGAPGDWTDHLPPELETIDRRDLTINYRSPTEINDLVQGLLAEIAPGLRPSQAIRSTGLAPRFVQVEDADDVGTELDTIVERLRVEFAGTIAVIAASDDRHMQRCQAPLDMEQVQPVSWLTPDSAKGLEFDVVVVVEPAEIWALPGGHAQLYVALTRPTQQLVVVHSRPLPGPLRPAATSI